MSTSSFFSNGGGDYENIDLVAVSAAADTALNAVASIAGIWTNFRNAKTANYSVAPADQACTLACGGSAYWTLSFGTPSSYPAAFTVMVVNEDSTRAKLVSAPGIVSFILWPKQSAIVFRQNNSWIVHSSGRWRLQANVTFYVDPLGSDTNDGLASGPANALATMQKAYNLISAGVDLSGNAVTIQLADGTYTAGINTSSLPVNEGLIVLQGNATTPSNTILSVTSNNAIVVTGAGVQFLVQNMKIQTSVSGCCILVGSSAVLSWNNLVFGACAEQHIEVVNFGQANCLGNYSIVGSAVSHLHAFQYGFIQLTGQTVTLTGTPAFGAFFAGANAAEISLLNTVFSGSATGPRYLSHLQGYININGNAGGATYLPGNSSGTVDATTFGLYA